MKSQLARNIKTDDCVALISIFVLFTKKISLKQYTFTLCTWFQGIYLESTGFDSEVPILDGETRNTYCLLFPSGNITTIATT